MDRIKWRRLMRHRLHCRWGAEFCDAMGIESNRRINRDSLAWIREEAKRHGMEVPAYKTWLDSRELAEIAGIPF